MPRRIAKQALYHHIVRDPIAMLKPHEAFSRTIPPFAALKAFEAFGRCGGIRKAAADLGLNHAVVSRHLRALEDWTGSRLIDRSSGQLTVEGAAYFAQVSIAMKSLAYATHDLMHAASSDRLAIWSVPGFASQWLSRELVSFGEMHKDLEIELRPADVPPDFHHNEADFDVRFYGDAWDVPPADCLLQSVEIARPRILAVASPDFLASFGRIEQPGDLLKAPLLHEEHDEQWRAWFAANGLEHAERLRGDRLWHAHLALTSARLGAGIALASSFLLGDDLASGRLVEVASPPAGRPPIRLGGYVLVGRKDRWNRPIDSAFRRWLCAAAAKSAILA